MKESTTKSGVGVTATLRLRYYINGKWKVKKCYCGKSTRRVSKKQKSKEVLQKYKDEMTKEAKTEALKACFKERLGFTEFKDVVSDELSRPIKV